MCATGVAAEQPGVASKCLEPSVATPSPQEPAGAATEAAAEDAAAAAAAAAAAEAAEDAAAAAADAALTPLERREKRVRRAKRAVRSELSVSGGDWGRRGYAASPFLLCVASLDDTLPRVDCRMVSRAQFEAQFEARRVPCILQHAVASWPAVDRAHPRHWSWSNLRARFGDHKFKVGSDDDGSAVRLALSHFIDYTFDDASGAGADDSPLYVFDGTFAEKPGSAALAEDYAVPEYFSGPGSDLFALAGARRRPPHRWVVFGPRRSGSSCHVDPLATAAWNALVSGRKRWALLPPGTPRAHAKPRLASGDGGEAAGWFSGALPAMLSDPSWPHDRPMQGVQHAGEVMFVPPGWWHAVLNLDHTLAVTHNFVSGANFDDAWRHTRKARPRLAAKWLEALRQHRPDLAARAGALDAAGGEVSESSPSSSSSSTSSEEEEEERRGGAAGAAGGKLVRTTDEAAA